MRTVIVVMLGFLIVGCYAQSATDREAEKVNGQQAQYSVAQPIPYFDYSLERDLLVQLYKIRNQRVSTHSVWRSDHGVIEGDCPSMGYGLPYDVSLTNPLVAYRTGGGSIAVGQAEPNGVFASTNTSATWVMCTGKSGLIEPVYVETKVTAYPYPVTVDYEKNRVMRSGKSSVNIKVENH